MMSVMAVKSDKEEIKSGLTLVNSNVINNNDDDDKDGLVIKEEPIDFEDSVHLGNQMSEGQEISVAKTIEVDVAKTLVIKTEAR